MQTSYEIHPAIGVARVGSSRLAGEEGYFFGPEPGIPSPERFRDKCGDVLRQAARFRVFKCLRDDRHRLIQADEVERNSVRGISWTVHLVNRKGTARRIYRSGPGFRNRATGDDVSDRALIIDPGPRSVSTAGERRVFDSGRFRDTEVTVGEIFMESGGQLVVLGGFGKAGSDPFQARLDPRWSHRADNNDWFDDISDGPVSVRLELADGTSVESTAWVMVGPPDYAPGIINQVTLYDIIYDLAVKRGVLTAPTEPPGRPSFARHIRPILERAMGYRWVNRAANFGSAGDGRDGHGPGGRGDFSNMWETLSNPSPGSEPLRRSITGRLRNPDPGAPRPPMDPLLLIPRLTEVQGRRSDAGNVLPLTRVQYEIMQSWAQGDFEADWEVQEPFAELLPDALDRVALEACVGGPLDPGIETNGVVLLDASRYMDNEPFRLSHAAVRPGEVTQYNAVPWQADYVSCRWEERGGPWPKRLAWWPAQRPDDVYTKLGENEMVSWTRGLGSGFQNMVEKWDRLGFVVDRGSPGEPFFVEDERDKGVLGP